MAVKAWYRDGTVDVTNGSTTVGGTNTLFSSQVDEGDLFAVGTEPFTDWYEIASVTDDTTLELRNSYQGSSASGVNYAVARYQLNQISNSDLAQRMSNLLSNWQGFSDEFRNWLGGSATATDTTEQKKDDGTYCATGEYPLTDAAGNEYCVPCPAKLEQDYAIKSYNGDPNGNVAAHEQGQWCIDTANGDMYFATAADGTTGGTTWVRGLDKDNLASNGGAIADWSDSTNKTIASRKEHGAVSGPLILTPDPLRMAIEAATGGRMTVLYDDADFPNYMHVIPRFRYEDLGYSTELGTGDVLAFDTGSGSIRSEIFVGAYQADANAASLPFRDPQVNVDFDSAKSQCEAKGAGWHAFNGHEWAAAAFWAMANGYEPRGNTDWGRAHDSTHEVGVREDGDSYAPGVSSGSGRILTGSGPSAWRHTNDPTGIADLVGNIWEWLGLFKIQDARILAAAYNDPSMAESSYTDTGVDVPNVGSASFQGWLTSGTQLTDRLLISEAGIVPQGSVWTDTSDERLPFRGGSRSFGSGAGPAALSLGSERTITSTAIGFRPAFVA